MQKIEDTVVDELEVIRKRGLGDYPINNLSENHN